MSPTEHEGPRLLSVAGETEPESVDEAGHAGADPLRAGIVDLRPSVDLEAARVEQRLAARMFGVEAEPVRIERFTILERLGEGGMGVVYSAYDPHLDRRVALKLLRSRGASHLERERLRREAHALARINHPNVVTVHEVRELENGATSQLFLVMEFVVGQDLCAWSEGGARPWTEVLDVYRQAARGLAAAHEAGLIHRDFKPANALLGDDGRVRVVDFGLAREDRSQLGDAVPGEDIDALAATGEAGGLGGDGVEWAATLSPTTATRRAAGVLTRPGARMGTPAYMSPEQHLGGEVGPASDQFSFCVALYEALYRSRPFVGDTLAELCKNLLAGAVCEPPRGAKVPTWLFAVLRRGLAVEPGDRYPSMTELLLALGRDPVQRRRRWFLGLGLTGLAATVGLAVGALMQRPGTEACSGSAEAIAAVWNPERRALVDRHLSSLPASYADTLAPRLLTQLDDYAGRWQEIHGDACISHHRGEQSDLLLDKRMACLARSKAAFDSAVEVLATADEQVFQSATSIVYDLPPLHACSDLEVLAAEVPPPEDPAVAREVAAARENLARATTLANAGKLTEALAQAQMRAEQAQRLNYPPLLAEALLLRGRIEFYQAGDAQIPSATLLEAAEVGLASRDDAAAVEALIRRLHIEAIRPGGQPIQDEDYALIRALLRRLPDPARLEGLFLNNAATVASSRGQLDQARLFLHRALEIKQGNPESSPLDLLETRFNLVLLTPDGVSQRSELEQIAESLEEQFGATYPMSLQARTAWTRTLRDPALIRQHLARVCDTYERSYPERLDWLGLCLYDLAVQGAAIGEQQQAAALFDRIAAMLEGPQLPPLREILRALARGRAALARGRFDEAVALLLPTAEAMRSSELPAWLVSRRAELDAVLGRAQLDAGQIDDAVVQLRVAVAGLEQVNTERFNTYMQLELAQTRMALARALLAQSPTQTDEINALLADAEAWFRDGGPSYTDQLVGIRSMQTSSAEAR